VEQLLAPTPLPEAPPAPLTAAARAANPGERYLALLALPVAETVDKLEGV